MRGAGITDELLISPIQYVTNVVMTLPAILYLDKFGRRPALLIGSFLMRTWLFTTGAPTTASLEGWQDRIASRPASA